MDIFWGPNSDHDHLPMHHIDHPTDCKKSLPHLSILSVGPLNSTQVHPGFNHLKDKSLHLSLENHKSDPSVPCAWLPWRSAVCGTRLGEHAGSKKLRQDQLQRCPMPRSGHWLFPVETNTPSSVNHQTCPKRHSHRSAKSICILFFQIFDAGSLY